MAYGNNPNTRIDLLETKCNEQIIELMETGSEAEREFDDSTVEWCIDRIDQLEQRLEKLNLISQTLMKGLSDDPHRQPNSEATSYSTAGKPSRL